MEKKAKKILYSSNLKYRTNSFRFSIMNNHIILTYLCILLCFLACKESRQKTETKPHSSLEKYSAKTVSQVVSKDYINPIGETIQERIALPNSFKRVKTIKNSFGDYLKNFPLKPHGTKVHLHNGTPKYTQDYHLAVLDIDTGKRDLQQCADAVMRLRAEFLFEQQRHDDIQFHFTNGFLAEYGRWKAGERISVEGNKVSWYAGQSKDSSHKSFRKYMDMVFSFAGTLSLNKELKSKPLNDLEIGDVFIQGGSPGHAVIVVDAAQHESNGEKLFLIAQSYMPAQDIHIIQNNRKTKYGPWYSISEIQNGLTTPEWSFSPEALKSF